MEFNASRAAARGSGEPPRQRFRVDLKQGQTNVICWKEVLRTGAMKDAEAGTATPVPNVNVVNSPCQCERTSESTSPVTVLSTQKKEQHLTASGVQQYRNVIDRIDALYSGVGNQEEEIDDNKYDSEDSFIDDRELNEYFAVDKTIKTKYSGFYVHRGPVEVVAADDPASPQAGAKKTEVHNGPGTIADPFGQHARKTEAYKDHGTIADPFRKHAKKRRLHTTVTEPPSLTAVVSGSNPIIKKRRRTLSTVMEPSLTDSGSKPEKRRRTTIMEPSLAAVHSGSTPNREEDQNHLIQSNEPSAAVQLKGKKRIVVQKNSGPLATSRQKPAQGKPKQCGTN